MSKRKNKKNINTMSTTELQAELVNAKGGRRSSIVALLAKRNTK